MYNLVFLVFFLLSFSAQANFNSGDLINPEIINNKFDNIQQRVQSRGFPFLYESFSNDEYIHADKINQQFNNFKSLSPTVDLIEFSPLTPINASDFNHNFNNINSKIDSELSQRSCLVDNGIGSQSFSDVLNSWGSCLATSCNDPYEVVAESCQAIWPIGAEGDLIVSGTVNILAGSVKDFRNLTILPGGVLNIQGGSSGAITYLGVKGNLINDGVIRAADGTFGSTISPITFSGIAPNGDNLSYSIVQKLSGAGGTGATRTNAGGLGGAAGTLGCGGGGGGAGATGGSGNGTGPGGAGGTNCGSGANGHQGRTSPGIGGAGNITLINGGNGANGVNSCDATGAAGGSGGGSGGGGGSAPGSAGNGCGTPGGGGGGGGYKGRHGLGLFIEVKGNITGSGFYDVAGKVGGNGGNGGSSPSIGGGGGGGGGAGGSGGMLWIKANSSPSINVNFNGGAGGTGGAGFNAGSSGQSGNAGNYLFIQR